MKSINTKSVLAALGIVAMLASPAFAKKAHVVRDQSGVSQAIPGYDANGGVVNVPDPDQR
jgi:hypothetical protein